MAVARLLISLGMRVNLVDNHGNTALDYAVLHERFDMVRILASMGADLNSASPWWSQAMIHSLPPPRTRLNAVLKEVREKREAHGESRKRKRDVKSTEACPNGQKRSAIISWTYSDTEAEEPKILGEDVAVIHENDQFLACVFPENSTTAAKRMRRSAPRQQEKYLDVSSVCAWDKSGFCMWFEY